MTTWWIPIVAGITGCVLGASIVILVGVLLLDAHD